ncbi:hypothetical protein E6H36_07785 [Candidatus Bathyarchaeota archaeon]|nr:MAG: hypothetical protein E6H36_07785 [Candidatus Bathyarchaeota archaeon]
MRRENRRQKMRPAISCLATSLILLSIGAQLVVGFTVNIGSQITSSSSVASQDPALLFNFKTQKAWIFWSQDPAGNMTIFYRIYDPSCLQSACLLPPMVRLSSDTHNNFLPSATQTLDGKIWVFWVSTRTGNNDIFYKVFNGTTWTSDTQFTASPGNDIHASPIATQDGGLSVAWASDQGCSGSTCISNIFLRKYDGTAWQPAQQVTFSGRDYQPSLAQASNSTFWLTWASDRVAQDGKSDLFYKTINSSTMGNDTELTFSPHDDEYPSIIIVKNGAMAVTWASDRNSTFDSTINATVPEYDIFLKYSLDGGRSWSTPLGSVNDIRLNQDPVLIPSRPVDDIEPSAAQLGSGKIGIVWQSDVTGNYNVFSMSLFIADAAVTAVTPKQTVLAKGKILQVNATLTDLGWEPETFPVTLSANGTTIQTIQATVPYQGTAIARFSWNTTGFPLGHYLLKVAAANLTGETNPANNLMTMTIMLSIPGDVDGNRIVNILDLVAVALSFGSTPGNPKWNPNADTDMNGIINIVDLTYVAIHFGQSG